MNQAALGRRLGIDRSDISVVLYPLQADRHITRSTDPAHSSRKLVHVTPTGGRTLRRLETHGQDAQRTRFAPLDPDAAAELTALLQRLVDHHRGYQHSQSSVTEEGVRGSASLDAGGSGSYAIRRRPARCSPTPALLGRSRSTT